VENTEADSVMKQNTDFVLSAFLAESTLTPNAQTGCKCNTSTFGIRPNASCFYTIFTLVNERTDVVQRSQSAPEHYAAITPVASNHHQNSFVEELFSWFHAIAARAWL